jgi:phosphatidylinositol alpha-mannosyltransferase
MKIAFVSPYDYAYPGGVTSHIVHLEQRFVQMGHEVKILAPCSKKIAGLGQKIIPVGRPVPVPNAGSIARMTLSLTLSPTVNRILQAESFDVVHIHEPLVPTLPLTVLRLADSLRVGTFHAYHNKPRGYGWGKFLLKKWFPRLDGRIAVSRPAMEFVSRHFPGDYEIIPNGIDTELYSPHVVPLEEWNDGKLNILFVGRFEKRKGIRYLLDAFREVKRQTSSARLILVGPGTRLRKGYEKMVAEDNLEDVVFIGEVPQQDLPRYYRTADIFCAPATGHESFGIILLEAMATGKPIVATEINGFASLMTHGVEGLLVPPKDKKALAEALLSLLHDKALCLKIGDKGRMKAEQYSWDRIAQRVIDYYQSLSKGPQGSM